MSIRDSLLQALDGKPGRVISGEKLARELNVSRAAIWKQLQALKSLGVPMESVDRHGYRLKVPFDGSLSGYQGPHRITAHYQISTASTQTLAKSGAAAGLPEGHLWMAEMQTKGRGRLDRKWESGFGGLWFSFLLRPTLSPLRFAPVTLLTGLCVRDAISKVYGIEAFVKWPNDVLVRAGKTWKKCAGILTEMSGQMERTDWATIGVGINVNNPITPELAEKASSLYALTGLLKPRAQLLDAFMKSFRQRYDRFCNDGFKPFRENYWKYYYAPRKAVSLSTADGHISGMAAGVDDSGALMVESRRKMMAIHEGEIIL